MQDMLIQNYDYYHAEEFVWSLVVAEESCFPVVIIQYPVVIIQYPVVIIQYHDYYYTEVFVWSLLVAGGPVVGLF
jgi:hypothetical protein